MTAPTGAPRIPARDLRGLRAAWRAGTLVPFLGAGVSLDYGVPAWKELVTGLLFREGREARRLRAMPPALARAVAAWLADYVEYDLTILARVAKRDARRAAGSPAAAERAFLARLRAQLYPAVAAPSGATTLDAVADLVAEGAREGRVPAVVTFNYDDLLERALAARGVAHHAVWAHGKARGPGVAVLHPHGFLPRRGALGHAGVVFSEDEYHRVSGTLFHGAVEDVLYHLRHHAALFLGLSMSDPNLRRLLDASHAEGAPPRHWQVQRRRRLPRDARDLAARDLVRRAGAAGDARAAAAALRVGLSLAERLDRELHRSMGVRTVWVDEHDHIPPLLRAIRARG